MTIQSLWETVVDQSPPIDSAVDFPTDTRFHLALNVKDVEAVLPFYELFFGKKPDLNRDGYAKFELAEPPLNISLNRVVHNPNEGHRLGVQARNKTMMEKMRARLENEGLIESIKSDDDEISQFSVLDPENNCWRIYA